MKLLNEQQVATMLGCSIFKLQKDRRTGRAIPFHKIGRLVKYDLREVEKYLERQSFNSTSEYEGGRND